MSYALLFLSWLFLGLVSLDHIFSIFPGFDLSVKSLGFLAWAVLFFTILILSIKFIRQALMVFIFFAALGVWFGPFLEPPSDPLEHLRRTHTYCDQQASGFPDKNMGFWHYSMSATMLCVEESDIEPETQLLKLDLLHGLFQGMLAVILFILGKSAGLPSRWAFLSCCLAFLFFGTDRFSYFRYYSFAPSSSSLGICWLWMALFFFRSQWKEIGFGLFSALILLPVLWVNHMQEAFFLFLLVQLWFILNIYSCVRNLGC